MAERLVTLAAKQVVWVRFPVPVYCGKVALFCNPASGGTFLSTAIEIIKWVEKFAVAQAKVTHILRPWKASEKTPKGFIPPSLCEISQNASRKKKAALHTSGRSRETEEETASKPDQGYFGRDSTF
jgi:hypothetical protein